MWRERKRLLLLIGLVALLAIVYVSVHGLPWSGPEVAADPGLGRPVAPTPAPVDSTPDGGTRTAPSASTNYSPAAYQRLVNIARRPEPDHLPELRQATRSKSPKTREAAVVGMSRLGAKSDTQALIERLKSDVAPQARAAAAAALGRLRCWEAGPALIDALEDRDTNVRARAGAALRRIMGVDFRFRANDPARRQTIQRIRDWWPKFYDGHVQSAGRKG